VIAVLADSDSDSDRIENYNHRPRKRRRCARKTIVDSSSEVGGPSCPDGLGNLGSDVGSPSHINDMPHSSPSSDGGSSSHISDLLQGTPIPLSELERKRQGRIARFDEEALDAILAAPPQLLNGISFAGRTWSHLNNPKACLQDKDFLARKRKEISARGGRKEQYGKILSKGIIRGRKRLGWHPNQTKPDAGSNIDNVWDFGVVEVEPAVHNGELVMADATRTAYGRKQRAVGRKFWTLENL